MEESLRCLWSAGLPKPFGSRMRHERRDATEHRQRILEVARRLFAERGVDAVSMHQIAMATGIGQGTLYRRYAHKGELCMDLLSERHQQFVEEIATQYAATATSPALERLDGVLAHFVAFLEEQGALLGPVAVLDKRDWQCNEADNFRRFSFQHAPFYFWMHELFAGLFVEEVRQEELSPFVLDFTTESATVTLRTRSHLLHLQ